MLPQIELMHVDAFVANYPIKIGKARCWVRLKLIKDYDKFNSWHCRAHMLVNDPATKASWSAKA